MNNLPDIQETEPTIKRAIQQVGVENVTVPFLLQLKSGGMRQMRADVSMRTNLESGVKGISMSRLLRTLKKYIEVPLKQSLIYEILKDLANNIGSKESHMKFDFRLPIEKKSPISDNSFPIYYKCSFEGQLNTKSIKEENKKRIEYTFKFFQGVTVQYASYCPCSTELCNDLKSKGSDGFPHAQRSYAHVLIKGMPAHYIWLEDIIELVERSVKTIPYPIIKREDEQEVARMAAENPIFVEDAIRAISEELDHMIGISDWIVKCIHEESIHTSEAIAINWKGVEGGFDYKNYL